ncbi:arsenical pump-driving ATPase [Rhodopirellula sp. MGV]|uniref:arsenical pump-driving ATPase n=1 Tax=Rhodopirellula sp. MGV TaxID=2023130 RepID=UPI000B95EAEF|nr:arsenical pump-driving ATPase [Rhodopirellula sp. MGV]OYP37912.1 arsenical pump-driving ATPase [Rhodopirellula sp. MGV]PNY37089.1 arsenical pump-driving ATPase [Rhodopirellula baltica]
MEFLNSPTRNLFFTGKGGVGKTSMACAAAVNLADRGLKVLLVSTDPASNLDEVLATKLSNRPTPVATLDNLWAMNIDPEQAASEYRERMVAPYRNVLPEAAIKSMEEQFSGSCTLEIAAFDEFAKLLGDTAATEAFDHVIFDTAPTGHTLRLLTLPSAWSGFMDTNTSGTSCLGPLAGLQAQEAIYKRTVASLANEDQTTLILVTRPDTSALREAERTRGELCALGVANQHLVINGIFKTTIPSDPIATVMQSRGDQAISSLPSGLGKLKRTEVPLASNSLTGIAALRAITSPDTPTTELPDHLTGKHIVRADDQDSISDLVDEFARQQRGVVLTMGKGGVGKTSVAAAIAVALAEKGLQVHLSTTDPAAHVANALAEENLDGLRVSRIDPAAETASYRNEVLRTAGAGLDKQGLALLEEDLRSPCTEEIAVFRAFARAVAEGEDSFVVLDTAPTGHTILLLDAAMAYHREVTRQSTQMPESVENLLPRLRDPKFTHILVVTLPESTPVHEAAKLQEDLRRAEIEPFAWVINQSLTPLTVKDPILVGRQQSEQPLIAEVISNLSKRTVLIPWLAVPPVGVTGLHQMTEANRHSIPERAST